MIISVTVIDSSRVCVFLKIAARLLNILNGVNVNVTKALLITLVFFISVSNVEASGFYRFFQQSVHVS